MPRQYSEAPEPVSASRRAYADRLGTDYWDYIERVNAFFPPATLSLPLPEQRQIYDRMCQAFHTGRREGIGIGDMAIELPDRRLPVRFYRMQNVQAAALVLFFHGGGFVFGGLDSHDDTAADLCAGTGFDVFSVDYRLAPEHGHPAAFDDALAAFDWLVTVSDLPIVLVGESAGGTLAAALAHQTRRHARPPAGQLLIYPSLGGSPGRSHYEHAIAPLLTIDDLATYRQLRANGDPPVADPTFEPLTDTSFAGLPPTVIVTAECDPLSSEGEAYRDAILAAGGHVVWREEPCLTHSFLRARHSVPHADDAARRITADLAMLGDGAGAMTLSGCTPQIRPSAELRTISAERQPAGPVNST